MNRITSILILLTLLYAFSCTSNSSPKIEMIASWDGWGNDLLITDRQDIYVTGYNTSSTSNSVFIGLIDTKYKIIDIGHNLASDYYIEGFAINEDANGFLITAGEFSNSLIYEQNENTYQISAQSEYETYIAKISCSGDVIWVNTWPAIYPPSWESGSHAINKYYSIDIDYNNNIFIGGQYFKLLSDESETNYYYLPEGSQVEESYIKGFDAGGNLMWNMEHIGISTGFVLDKYGNIYSTGVKGISQTASGNTDLFTNSNFPIFYITKYSNDGSIIFDIEFKELKLDERTGYFYPQSIYTINHGDNIVIVGIFQQSPLQVVSNNDTMTGADQIYRIIFSQLGEIISSTKLINTSNDSFISIIGGKEIMEEEYLIGDVNGSLSDLGTIRKFGEGGSQDILILTIINNKLSEGIVIGGKEMDWIKQVSVKNKNDIIITGQFSESLATDLEFKGADHYGIGMVLRISK